MIKESTAKVPGGGMHYLHNKIDRRRPTLLLIHGLGESSLCFLEAFHQPGLNRFNIIAPDLLGFGNSSEAKDQNYSLNRQRDRILKFLEQLMMPRVYLVGHSMGGDLGTLLCEKARKRFAFFVNVEGNLTPADRFITTAAMKAVKACRFTEWFREELCEKIVLEWCRDWPSCVRYYASLRRCREAAFIQSVEDIYRLNGRVGRSKHGRIGAIYRDLRVPRVFCWGANCLTPQSQQFLARARLRNRRFAPSFHWVMLDCCEEFYNYVAGLLDRS